MIRLWPWTGQTPVAGCWTQETEPRADVSLGSSTGTWSPWRLKPQAKRLSLSLHSKGKGGGLGLWRGSTQGAASQTAARILDSVAIEVIYIYTLNFGYTFYILVFPERNH